MSNVTFHSKGPCLLPYVRTSGPEKSATRIPNLQATTTQSLKDSCSGGFASCSLQLLLRVMNVQAIHMLCPLVHQQRHMHDALGSGPQHLMWLHDLMLSYSTQLRKAFECLKSPQKLGCATISRNTATGSQHLIFKSQQFFCGLCISMCIMYSQNYSKWLAT